MDEPPPPVAVRRRRTPIGPCASLALRRHCEPHRQSRRAPLLSFSATCWGVLAATSLACMQRTGWLSAISSPHAARCDSSLFEISCAAPCYRQPKCRVVPHACMTIRAEAHDQSLSRLGFSLPVCLSRPHPSAFTCCLVERTSHDMRRLACRLSGWQWGLEELMAGCMELDALFLSLCLWPVLCLTNYKSSLYASSSSL